MIEFTVLLSVLFVVGGTLWLLVIKLIEDWKNPPKHWTEYENERFMRLLAARRAEDARRQKLIDQL